MPDADLEKLVDGLRLLAPSWRPDLRMKWSLLLSTCEEA
jgi:hypothetical protein